MWDSESTTNFYGWKARSHQRKEQCSYFLEASSCLLTVFSTGGDHRCKNVCSYGIYVCAIRRKTFYSNERVARQQRQMCVFWWQWYCDSGRWLKKIKMGICINLGSGVKVSQNQLSMNSVSRNIYVPASLSQQVRNICFVLVCSCCSMDTLPCTGLLCGLCSGLVLCSDNLLWLTQSWPFVSVVIQVTPMAELLFVSVQRW